LARRRDGRFPLDDLSTEILRLTARRIAEGGYSLDEALANFKAFCEEIPRSVGQHSRRCPIAEPGQVLTLWYTKPEYLNKRARPIQLPLYGPAPSIEALVNEVHPLMTVSEALDYLDASHMLKRDGALFAPRSRFIRLPAKSAYQSALHLKALAGLLRTIDHNAQNERQWFQYVAEGLVPEHTLRSAVRDFRPSGMELLKYADDFILRRAGDQKRKCRAVPLSVGIYVYRGPTDDASGRGLKPNGATRKARHSARTTTSKALT